MTVFSNSDLYGVTVAGGRIYARTTTSVYVANENGTTISKFAMQTQNNPGQSLGTSNQIDTVVVDPTGNIYFVMFDSTTYNFAVVSLSPTGSTNWTHWGVEQSGVVITPLGKSD